MGKYFKLFFLSSEEAGPENCKQFKRTIRKIYLGLFIENDTENFF